MTEKTLAQRMIRITDESSKIRKNGYNNYSKYDYVKAVDVFNEVQKLLVKNGVGLSISEVEYHRERFEKDKGGFNFHSIIKNVARFYSVDNKEDFEEVSYYATAADTLDKDIYKAKTGGLKYLFTQRFLIVTDDVIDPEEERQPKNQQAAQRPVKNKQYIAPTKQPINRQITAKTSLNPGDYTINCKVDGPKGNMKGLMLKDVPIGRLEKACDYWHGKDQGDKLKEDINAMNEYIRFKQAQEYDTSLKNDLEGVILPGS